MFIRTGTVEYSIGEIFESNGVPLTAAQNSRELYGYSVHDHLNTMIDGHPQLQIVEGHGNWGCPELIKTFPTLRIDDTDSRKIAPGNDHYVIALAYYCMGHAAPRQDPQRSTIPQWMRPKTKRRVI
jgi:hypothetical protein